MSNPTGNVWLNLIICIPGMFIPFIILSLPVFITGWLNHLGEEFAWRGYLFRRTSQSGNNLVKGAAFSGVIWWAWHFPMFRLSPIIEKLNLWQMIITVLLSIFALTGTAIVYSWIYVKSGSIWAPTIMHLFWNLYRSIFTGRLADGTPGIFKGNLWIINGEGIIGMIVTIFVANLFLFFLFKLERNKSNLKLFI